MANRENIMVRLTPPARKQLEAARARLQADQDRRAEQVGLKPVQITLADTIERIAVDWLNPHWREAD